MNEPAESGNGANGGLRRSEIVFASKDRALRDDVRTLGRLIGALLREQGGESLYELVENARRISIRRREGGREAAAALTDLVQALPPDTARDVIRAFSTYFELVNTAEKVHRIRRRRDYLRDEDSFQPGGLEYALRDLHEAGISNADLDTLLHRLRIQPVFTAHPTEPTRRTILRKEQNIVRHLVDMLNPTLTPQEERTALASIRAEVTAIWQTEEHPSESMTVADELEHVLFFLTDVLYRVLPPFYESLEDAIGAVYGQETLDNIEIPDLISFASWVGGDMDGNPNVGAKTIRETLTRQRSLILDLYYRECGRLSGKLSQTVSRVGVAPAILERIEVYRGHFPHAWHAVPARHREMPYRVYLRLVQERLQSTYDDSAFPYESAEEFEADIRLIATSLRANRGRHAGLFAVRRLLRRIRTFGFHLLTLDVRQDALVHREVVGRCLGIEDWLEWTPEARATRLREALQDRELPKADSTDTRIRKTLAVFQAISFCRRKYGRRAIGPFIVSMTQGADDVLTVLLLARWGDLASKGGKVPLDIAPLFETVDDLRNGTRIMQELLGDAVYRKHLAHRNDEQMIMVGYSDSNKDSGLASARWALYEAQADLVRELDSEDLDITLFHGRGGTTSRGGGKTHAAVLGAPADTLRGRLRVTEQGEIINEKYGLRGIALRTLEQLMASVSVATANPERTTPEPDEWRQMMDTVAAESRKVYRGLVYDRPGFFDYFRCATPIDVIERMRIGSRPSSRRKQRGIQDLRAIPWVFAWTQSRHILPGWFGFGSGLRTALEMHGEEAFTAMTRDWFYLQSLLSDVEMVLAKSDMTIASRYSELAGTLHEKFFPVIREEFELTRDMVLKLTGNANLLEKDKTMQRAIMLRNPYVDPMSLLQVDLLARWRAKEREDDELFAALLASVNGIAQGLQNTG